jgi:hypothetical protein
MTVPQSRAFVCAGAALIASGQRIVGEAARLTETSARLKESPFAGCQGQFVEPGLHCEVHEAPGVDLGASVRFAIEECLDRHGLASAGIGELEFDIGSVPRVVAEEPEDEALLLPRDRPLPAAALCTGRDAETAVVHADRRRVLSSTRSSMILV